jgi:hypothetical protein
MATYQDRLVVSFGGTNTGLASSMQYQITDSTGTIQASFASTLGSVTESTNTPGLYTGAIINVNLAWLPLTVDWQNTGRSDLRATEIIRADAKTVAVNNDKTGYALTTAPPTVSQIAGGLLANPTKPLANNIADGSILTDKSAFLPAPRDLSTVADNAMTVGDALWSAVSEFGGQQTQPSISTWIKKTPAGTIQRNFTTNPNNNAPTSRS